MAGVLDGQPVDAAVTNPAFIIKNADDTTPSRLGLACPAPDQGGSITAAQQELNGLDAFTGRIANAAATSIPPWTNNDVGLSSDSLFARANKITLRFSGTTGIGHGHTGVDGDGPLLTGASISNNPATPQSVGTTNSIGATGNFAWDSHIHQGVHSIAASGSSPLFGDITVVGASGASVSQSGSILTVAVTAAAGGGGGSLSWVESLDSAIPTVEYNNEVYLFGQGQSQKIFALVKVPSSYTAGNPINMKTTFYSPDSSGTVLIETVSTLIRPGTDAINSLTNQHVSSNSAVTLGAGTVNIPQSLTLDITDSSGKMNGVSVSPGDLINVELTRGTSTATSDARVPVYGTEVTFT